MLVQPEPTGNFNILENNGRKHWCETHILILRRLYHVHQSLNHFLFIQPLKGDRVQRWSGEHKVL